MKPIYSPRTQNGTVLVTVLMMFAIAAFLASEMAYRQKLDVRRTSAMLMTEQAREYLTAAEELSMLALKDDFKADKKRGDYIDGLGDEWALKRPPFPVDGGLIQGEIVDAQGKFNLNDLVDKATGKDSTPQAQLAAQRFKDLCNSLGVPKEGSAEALYERVLDWIDVGQDEKGNDGREDSAYLSAKRPHRTANRLFVDVSELRSIEGMDLETFDKLEPYLTVLPPGTPLNLNTAKAELLTVYGVRNAQQLAAQRERDPIEKNRIGEYAPELASIRGQSGVGDGATGDTGTSGTGTTGTGGGLDQAAINEMFSTNSNYFELKAKAVIGDRTVYSRSLIYRPPEGAPNGNSGKLEVIYRAYVDPLQQPMTPLTNNNNQSG